MNRENYTIHFRDGRDAFPERIRASFSWKDFITPVDVLVEQIRWFRGTSGAPDRYFINGKAQITGKECRVTAMVTEKQYRQYQQTPEGLVFELLPGDKIPEGYKPK